MSVRQTMLFHSFLREPGTHTRNNDTKGRINALIEDLGLVQVKHTRVKDLTVSERQRPIHVLRKKREMLPYFALIEYPCPAFKNPSDYYLDLVTLDDLSSEAMLESSQRIDQLASTFKRRMEPLPDPGPPGVLPSKIKRANFLDQIFGLWIRALIYMYPFNVIEWVKMVLLSGGISILTLYSIPGIVGIFLAYIIPGYLLAGIHYQNVNDLDVFYYYIGYMMLYLLSIRMMIMCFVHLSSSRHWASAMGGTILVILSLVNGYVIHVKDLGDWTSWIKYVSPQYWMNHPIQRGEFSPISIFHCKDNPVITENSIIKQVPCGLSSGNKTLDYFQFGDKFQNIVRAPWYIFLCPYF
ncbi:unnamed protein product [Lepeophtheirus salmonis]|uniref:(salmon louse) hypothetical protein n=1 Tax=Lepeophtheirus salmonis TaxID=72036 RepID=A0A7R8H6J0_LEPSM|nr:unnamed protein product [Lepeophtheirus salmonis]CAF2900394.1 unnamed protein product [Lepeophtheirus salmonis]